MFLYPCTISGTTYLSTLGDLELTPLGVLLIAEDASLLLRTEPLKDFLLEHLINVLAYFFLWTGLHTQGPHFNDNNEASAKVTTKYGRR